MPNKDPLANDPIIQYLKALHDHGVGSKEAAAIKDSVTNDPVFAKRAAVAEKLFRNRKLILAELQRLENQHADRD